jgi:hypothetical protein
VCNAYKLLEFFSALELSVAKLANFSSIPSKMHLGNMPMQLMARVRKSASKKIAMVLPSAMAVVRGQLHPPPASLLQFFSGLELRVPKLALLRLMPCIVHLGSMPVQLMSRVTKSANKKIAVVLPSTMAVVGSTLGSHS